MKNIIFCFLGVAALYFLGFYLYRAEHASDSPAFGAATRKITVLIDDTNGKPIKDIEIRLFQDAVRDKNNITKIISGFDRPALLLRTDEDGQAKTWVYSNQMCDFSINGYIDGRPSDPTPKINVLYSDEAVRLIPSSTGLPWGDNPVHFTHDVASHTYCLKSPEGLVQVWQACWTYPLSQDPLVIHIYLRRTDSASLPDYRAQLPQPSSGTDPDSEMAQQANIASTIQAFSKLDEILSPVANEEVLDKATLEKLCETARQIDQIAGDVRRLVHDKASGENVFDEAEREKSTELLYCWLTDAKTPLPSHQDRITYIQNRMDEASEKMIQALHPLMLKDHNAYRVLESLGVEAHSAMRFYPEVFEKGTDEAKEAALATIISIAPSLREIVFLIRSKNPDWIEKASAFCINRSPEERTGDISTLQALKSQESDPKNIAAFDRVIDFIKSRAQ